MLGIGTLVGKMFGTDKAAASAVDGLKNGLDKLIYTKEEIAEDAAADVSEARKMFIDWMRTTSGQNLARRLIALIVTGVWVFQYLTALALSGIAVWVEDPIKWRESAKLVGDYAEQMNGAMMLILGFYFAAPHLGKVVDKAMDKFGRRVS
jgi:hypothetical protein